MIESKTRGVLLDIEGTTSSISFVYDVMFPFVRKNMESFLQTHWSTDQVQQSLPLLADDLGQRTVSDWLGDGPESEQRAKVCQGVNELMDADVKATGLKQFQGFIWKDGFDSGQLVSHLFDDVAPAIRQWHAAGVDIRIYSSGSIAAQKLFFGHTMAGNLSALISGHYDTATGPKKDSQSYDMIAADFGIPAGEILFLSDVTEELEAARKAGMQTALSVRPGNSAVESGHEFMAIESFSELDFLTQ